MFPIAAIFENLTKWTMIFQLNCSNEMKIIVTLSLHKKLSFRLRISSLNVTKSSFLRIWSHLLKKSLMGNHVVIRTFKNEYEFLIFISIFILILQSKTQKIFAPIFLLAMQISNLTSASHCCLFPVLRQCK